MESKKASESNSSKNMWPVVERMNAGYDEYFNSKQQTATKPSECYSNYLGCGSKDKPKLCVVKTEDVGTSNEGSNARNNSPSTGDSKHNILQEVAVLKIYCHKEQIKKFIFQFLPRVQETDQRQPMNGSGCCKYLPVKRESE